MIPSGPALREHEVVGGAETIKVRSLQQAIWFHYPAWVADEPETGAVEFLKVDAGEEGCSERWSQIMFKRYERPSSS